MVESQIWKNKPFCDGSTGSAWLARYGTSAIKPVSFLGNGILTVFDCQRVRLGFTPQRTWATERTHKGSMGRFGRDHDIRQLRNHTWDSFRVLVRCGKTTTHELMACN
ncbi:hypothetical protein PIB30_056196 [Stylosanthes scabra]|uniref:Uncharacterized protein n=1 Tax=Stylosanthes scabra TaxID=79078 RepID=A0ABU6WL17_9FABA|nr:hypothetical protein [Stylosanthes scabra]